MALKTNSSALISQGGIVKGASELREKRDIASLQSDHEINSREGRRGIK